MMPFVTEEIWSLTCRASATCSPRAAGRRRTRRCSTTSRGGRRAGVKQAVTALRRYRDEVGAARARVCPRAWRPRATTAAAEHVARLTRFEFVADGDEAEAGRDSRPGGAVRSSPPRNRRRGGRRGASPRGGRSSRWRSSAPRASWPTTFVEGAGRGRRAPSARSSPRYRAELETLVMTLREAEEYLLGLELFGMRFGLDRMHKLMTVLGMPQRRFA